jgi:hypothetical protein
VGKNRLDETKARLGTYPLILRVARSAKVETGQLLLIGGPFRSILVSRLRGREALRDHGDLVGSAGRDSESDGIETPLGLAMKRPLGRRGACHAHIL